MEIKSKCIENICRLPVEFKANNGSSIFSLAQQSGFIINQRLITQEDIKSYLAINLSLIENWMLYSVDKRSSGYFLKSKHIGAIDENGNIVFSKAFESDLDACSEFILREFKSILGI